MKRKYHINQYQGARYIAPLLVILIAICITIPLIAQSDDPIGRNRAQERLHQALYHIHAQAQQTGWTDDLNRLAGDIYSQMNDLPRAVAYWERANLIDPLRLALLADGYIQLEQWANATSTLRRLMEIDPNHEWALWHSSILISVSMNNDSVAIAQDRLAQLVLSQNYGASASSIAGVLSSDNPSYEKSLQLGLILASLDRWSLAELAFQQAGVNYVMTWATTDTNNLGGVYGAYEGLARYMQGKPADEWFERALQSDPQDDQVHYVYGMYLRGMGDIQGSLDALARAITLNPNNPAYYMELGITYYTLNDTELGDYWLEFARRMDNESETLQTILDDFYAQRQSMVFDFDALQALLEATPEATPEITPELTSEATPEMTPTP